VPKVNQVETMEDVEREFQELEYLDNIVEEKKERIRKAMEKMNTKKVSNTEEMLELKQEFEKKKMKPAMKLLNLKSDEEHMKQWRLPEKQVTNKKICTVIL
jgi:hypothetical protein